MNMSETEFGATWAAVRDQLAKIEGALNERPEKLGLEISERGGDHEGAEWKENLG